MPKRYRVIGKLYVSMENRRILAKEVIHLVSVFTAPRDWKSLGEYVFQGGHLEDTDKYVSVDVLVMVLRVFNSYVGYLSVDIQALELALDSFREESEDFKETVHGDYHDCASTLHAVPGWSS